ncbi:MAG TPA: glycosyltransferase family 1 protein [Bacteroidia bacterium]|nr:glycosyltransferase family 1 protein [Bacteroidia bacterium]
MIKNILIPMPNKVHKGGICSYWSAMFNSFKKISDIEFKVVKIGNRGKNVFGPPLDQWKFHKACSADIDLVILNPSVLNKAFFREGLLAKQLIAKKIPFMAFFHGWDLDFEKRVTERYQKFFLNSYAHAEKIITLSPEAKNKIIDWGYKGEVLVETTVVASTLIENFSIEEKLLRKKSIEKIQILFLARMEKEKGIFELIDAFQELSLKIPNLELILAGKGTAYDAVVKYVGTSENIKFVGHIEGEAKAAIFRESDIYCLPSYSEGLPVSVLEAMAFGLPIVTTSVGGLKYFFKEGKMGYFCMPKERKSLKNALEALILNPNTMLEMAHFNFEYAQKHLMSDAISKRLYGHLTLEKELIQEVI